MYLDISDHGVIGNPRTAALVGTDGSIDWCCFPFFHSPSIFAALLDDESGGRFAVTLDDGTPMRQRYESATNVLRTTIDSPAGTIRITDFMPYFMDHGEMVVRDELLRRVECTDGEPTVRIAFDPRLDYAREETTVETFDAGCRAMNGEEVVTLESTVDFERSETGATGHRELNEAEAFWLACRYDNPEPSPLDTDALFTKLEQTRQYWKTWCRRCTYEGEWPKAVRRSALALKLLTYEPTGAIVAAATTSLPEMPEGTRNWDALQ